MQINGVSLVVVFNVQSATAQFTTEAELSVYFIVLREVPWLYSVLGEIRTPMEEPSASLQDNQAASRGCRVYKV